jgi:tellurite resistance protein TerC
MVEQFEWILGLFGLFLVYSGGKMFGHDDEQLTDPSKNIFVKWFKKFFPVTDKMHGDKFFIREEKPETRNLKPETKLLTLNSSLLTKKATPLFVALIVIETTDVAFAVDSIPAVFSVSRDPFIVLTSNIFAILGLRAMYFALAAVAKYFKYLKYGLGFILIFVGIKMLLAMDEYINALLHLVGIRYTMPHIEISTPFSLSVIFGLLTLSILLSLAVKRKG